MRYGAIYGSENVLRLFPEEKNPYAGNRTAGQENAINYIRKKYGFVPEVEDITVCKVKDDGSFFRKQTKLYYF